MLWKRCPRCGARIKKDYNYCPYCGKNLREEKKERPLNMFEFFFSGIDDLFKEIEKNFMDLSFESFPGITITLRSEKKPSRPLIKETKSEEKSEEKIKEISEKQKERKIKEVKEPETKIKHLADRIIYEIDVPGVKSKDDVEIRKLQNSTEIKAFAGDKAFFKLIPIALDVIRYDLKNGKLIIEFKA